MFANVAGCYSFFLWYGDHRDLHSFPTRRSSDLDTRTGGIRAMTITDDIVKSLRNPTPLYAVAGTADLAAAKLREVPALLDKLREQAPERIEKIRGTDPKGVQQRVTAQAKDASSKAQSKLNETISGIDLDLKKLGGSV